MTIIKIEKLLHQPELVKHTLLNGFLEQLDKDDFNLLITAYVLNHDLSGAYGVQTNEQRDQIALCVVQQPKLVNYLYPVSRILLFSRIQQMEIFQKNEPSFLSISEEMANQIKASYKLPLHLDQLVFWLPCLAGIGSADYWGRFQSVYETALGYLDFNQQIAKEPLSSENALQAEALAMSLIQDPRFIHGFKNSYFPNRPFCKLTNEQRIKLGEKYLRIAMELYENQKEMFAAFSLEEKARLALAHPTLMIKILDSNIQEDSLAIFSTIEGAKINTELKYYSAIDFSARADEGVAFKLYNDGLFKKISDDLKVKIALQHPRLVQKMISDNFLEKLDKDSFSFFTTCYVVNGDNANHYGSMTEEQRDQMALTIVQRPVLVYNLHPAARFLLFSRIQQMEIFRLAFEENLPLDLEEFYATTAKLNQLTISEEILQRIVYAYSLPKKKDKIIFWLYSILNMGTADYWGRFNEVYQTAIGVQSAEQIIQAETLAMSLVQDSRFIHGLNNKEGSTFCTLKSEQRVALGVKYPAVAFELFTNKKSQGATPFTLAQLLEVAKAHENESRILPFLHHFKMMEVEYGRKPTQDKIEICWLYENNEPTSVLNSNDDNVNNNNAKPAQLKNVPKLATLAMATFWKKSLKTQNDLKNVEITDDAKEQLLGMYEHLQLFK